MALEIQLEVFKQMGADKPPEASPSRPAATAPQIRQQDSSLIMKHIKRMSRDGWRDSRAPSSEGTSVAGSSSHGHDPVHDSPTSQKHQDGGYSLH